MTNRSESELRDARGEAPALLVPGETCWRIETVDHLGVLIDAADYFAALRKAIASAREHVVIVGWDVDSRTRLVPERRPHDGLPAELLPFLLAVLRRRPELQVYILAWDFSLIYALEREFLPSFTFKHAHPRLHFALDGNHPVGAAHHQKLVVIDGRLAFAGGIDLTIRRWDRSAHRVIDPARRDPEGALYAPMHDVQLCFDGPAARAIAELACERWSRACLEPSAPRPLPPAAAIEPDLWPSCAPVDFRATPVGIARTRAGTPLHPEEVHEIAALTQLALRSARDYVYIENQYLTAAIAANALIESLSRATGPEIITVLPKVESGWLEQSSMGVLRSHVLARLREADAHGRLHLYYPKLADDATWSLNVHTKLLIADGVLLKIGSANLSNRSLGLDSECDIAVEARAGDRDSAATRQRIERVLQRLLAEHLALSVEECAAHTASGRSIVALIERRRGAPRHLAELSEADEDPPFDLAALGDVFVDPERPMAPETFLQSILPTQLRYPVLRSALASAMMLLPVALTALWFHAHAPVLEGLRHLAHSVLPVWLVYTLGCLCFVPISMLLAVTAVVFDPMHAFLYGLSGALLAAIIAYAVGRRFRNLTLRYLRGHRVRHLQRTARVRAFRATVIARLLPVGNFTASNLLAGALNVAFWPFVVGNLAGLSFGITLLVSFAEQWSAALREPNALHIGASIAAGLIMIALCYALARWFARPQPMLHPRRDAQVQHN